MKKICVRTACALLVIGAAALTGCSTQAPYVPESMPVAWSWTGDVALSEEGTSNDEAWWRVLGDSAIDELMHEALAGNPTLDIAIARMNEANAAYGTSVAQQTPTLGVNAGSTRARSAEASGQPAIRAISSAGLGLNWEVDLFGRLLARPRLRG